MPAITDDDLAILIEQRITLSNKDVYIRKSGDPYFKARPSCIYFYYMKWVNNLPYIRHYFYNNGKTPIQDKYLYQSESDEIGDIIRELAINATDTYPVPPVFGSDFDGLVWRKKSYIVILMDDKDWTFPSPRSSPSLARGRLIMPGINSPRPATARGTTIRRR